jgi:hypothetical protein
MTDPTKGNRITGTARDTLTSRLIQDSFIDLEVPTPSCNDQLSIKIAE